MLPSERPSSNELWPRLEDRKYRWELHSYGLPERNSQDRWIGVSRDLLITS